MRKYLWMVATAFALLVSVAMGDPGNGNGAGARQHAWKDYVRQQTGPATATHSTGDGDLVGQQAQYDFERTAPAGFSTGPAFASGIATNYGGAWHQINMTGLPNRYISG